MRLIRFNFDPKLLAYGAAAVLLAVLVGCAETQLVVHTAKTITRDDGPPPRGVYKVGKPYKINGVWYYPSVDYEYQETGIASWYGPKFHGRPTANNERFDQNAISAAHRTLPLPSIVRVTNLENGRAIRVRVNDRGPFAHGRIIDLSRRAAQLLAFERQGTAKVRVEIVANDSRQLALLYGRGAGQVQIARANGRSAKTRSDTPAIRPAPRIKVTAQPLPAAGQPGRASQGSARQTAPTQSALALPAQDVEPKVDGHITQEPISRTRMYIQVGAFAQYVNAYRLKTRLSVLGPTNVLAIKFKEQQMFRVRIGPIHDLKAADHMLSRVIGAGYTSARLIVDR